MKRVVVALSVFSMMVFGASTLSAVQPDMWTDSGGGIGFVGTCGDFDVYEEVTFDIVGKDYYDKDGNWIRTKAHWEVEGKVFNPDNGKSLPYKNSVYNVFNYPESQRIAGLWALVTVPGEGQIFVDVGLIIFDPTGVVFEAGKHQWWDGNVDALCGHLAD